MWICTKYDIDDEIQVTLCWKYNKNIEVSQVRVKGTLPQNIFIIKSIHIGHMNSLNIGVLIFFKEVWQK